MIQYIKNKILRHKQKHTFSEYGFSISNVNLQKHGVIQYAHWHHPTYWRNQSVSAALNESIVEFYSNYVKSGTLAIDIGAHEGDTTVPMALAAGKNGKVIALEPNPYVFKVLEQNAKLNLDKTQILALNVAATAHDGEFDFGSGDAAYGNGGVVGFSTNTKSNTRYRLKVKGINLLDYLTKNFDGELDKLSLIKSDVEGYDKEILKSILPLLSKYKPTVICEVFNELSLAERQELYNLLAGVGYDVHRLPDFAGSAPQRIEITDMQKWKHFDIIAFPKN